jgi:catechol 2,3-dioxygenase-like lactoylglutathione lyase family enzyme
MRPKKEYPMARIKHIAITSQDPAGTTEFYKKHFDLKKLHRQPRDTGDAGVWLSDGYIYFAILKQGPDTPSSGLTRHRITVASTISASWWTICARRLPN